MAESNWRDLCERIRNERDPEELMTLVEELNRTLARQERERQYRSRAKPRKNIKKGFFLPAMVRKATCRSARDQQHYSQPLVRAMRAASTRLLAPNLLIASER
jgi:hypothetical protein